MVAGNAFVFETALEGLQFQARRSRLPDRTEDARILDWIPSTDSSER